MAVSAFVLVFVGVGLYVRSQSHASGGYCINYDWSQGSSGACVSGIQTMLNAYYKDPDGATYGMHLIATDGVFGPDTRGDLVDFQKSMRIKADGVVGPQTWGYLCGNGGYSNGKLNAGYKVDGCAYR